MIKLAINKITFFIFFSFLVFSIQEDQDYRKISPLWNTHIIKKALKTIRETLFIYEPKESNFIPIVIYMKEYNGIHLNFVLEIEEKISKNIKIGNYVIYIRNIEDWKNENFFVSKGYLYDNSSPLPIHDVNYRLINNKISSLCQLQQKKLNYIIKIEKYAGLSLKNDINVFIVEVKYKDYVYNDTFVLYQNINEPNNFMLP